MKRTSLNNYGNSETAILKREIQRLAREIVIARDGGCIFRIKRRCGGYVGSAVLQADHLITRSNSATYADTRLIVCLCTRCHGGWKKWHKEAYDALVKTVISPDRVALWERCESDSWRPSRRGAYDWKLAILALQQELRTYETRGDGEPTESL